MERRTDAVAPLFGGIGRLPALPLYAGTIGLSALAASLSSAAGAVAAVASVALLISYVLLRPARRREVAAAMVLPGAGLLLLTAVVDVPEQQAGFVLAALACLILWDLDRDDRRARAEAERDGAEPEAA